MDDHDLLVIASDNGDVVPQKVRSIVVHNGERFGLLQTDIAKCTIDDFYVHRCWGKKVAIFITSCPEVAKANNLYLKMMFSQ